MKQSTNLFHGHQIRYHKCKILTRHNLKNGVVMGYLEHHTDYKPQTVFVIR